MSQLDDLRIDKNNLDKELVEQPQRFFEVCEELVISTSRRDKLKQTYDYCEADRRLFIRSQMVAAGDKSTEKTIDAQLEVDDQRLAAQDQLLAANSEVQRLESLKEAWRTRGFVLRDLCQLYIANYYGNDTSVSPVQNGREAVRRVENDSYERNKQVLAQRRRQL